MEDVVKYIIDLLVMDKDSVVITTNIENNDHIINVKVAEDDLGRVIGKNGRIAQSIRTIVKSLGAKQKTRYIVKISNDKE